MSLSKNQIISILAERQGRAYDIVFWKELSDMIDYWRATIIKQTLQKSPQSEIHYIQSIVVSVIKTNTIECPISYGCSFRTKDVIPTTINITNTPFRFVGTADFSNAYSPIEEHQIKFYKHKPYTGNNPKYFLRDGYLYFTNLNGNQKYVGIKDIFTDLNQLHDLECDGNCYSDDDPYPAPEAIIQQIIQSILGVEFRQPIPEDKKDVPINK